MNSPLFTDLYQLTMAETYLASGRHEAKAVFELFFRRNPFRGEYAVLAGYNLVQDILETFKFSEEDISYLQSLDTFKNSHPQFWTTLRNLNLNDIEVLGVDEGELVFPRLPLLQVYGPLWKAQLLESALLNAINYSTLVATCARRMWVIAKGHSLVEFGMRRAQGPNGAMTATRSSYIGGFDGTSNVLGGKVLGIPVMGTMAHSFVQSYRDIDAADLAEYKISDVKANRGELGAFLAYARVYPDSALFLVDTYDTLKSGVPNAIEVFKILKRRGYKPLGIRLDSGDLVYLSRESRKMLDAAGLKEIKIFASNELDEEVIQSLQSQGAAIDAYGVGTQLVTAASQPALGGVYKLVELDGHPRMKISQQTEKLVLPAAKAAYRFIGKDGHMILDLLTERTESAPQPQQEVMALHPSDPFKRARAAAQEVRPLLKPLFKNGKWLKKESLLDVRNRSLEAMKELRDDISRFQNPTPYKVSITQKLKNLTEELYDQEAPPAELV